MSATAKRGEVNLRDKLASLENQNRYGAGWADLTAILNNSNAAGLSPPAWKSMGANGHYGLHFTAGESAFCVFHVPHGWAGTLSYPHVHFLVDIALTAGDTITWKLHYTVARRGHEHHTGESLTGARTTLTLTYTADGNEVAGEHIVIEDDTQTIDMLEVDALVIMEVEMDAATVTGTEEIFGLMCDIHYESDGMLTKEKAPKFTKNEV